MENLWRLIFTFILFFHGVIHLMGFAKAFGYGHITQLTKDISKPAGIIWLMTAILFLAAAIQFIIRKDIWWITGLAAIILSQIMIVISWQDASFGTYVNFLVLTVAILFMGNYFFESGFKKDVLENLKRNHSVNSGLLTESDIQPLPFPVKRYLKYAGVLNTPKLNNVHIVFTGQMRGKGRGFMEFTSEQYNFFDEPARLFFMKGKMFGITVPGYHKYTRGTAIMDIRLFGLFPIVKQSGTVMNKTETVTLFNDMCLMAPASLIDKRIKWQEIDSNTVKASFTNHDIGISAILYFNDEGQLINFISDDRTEINDMKQYPFSTPVSAYKNVNGINVMSHGEAVYQYPDEKFTYGKFNLEKIEYNTE